MVVPIECFVCWFLLGQWTGYCARITGFFMIYAVSLRSMLSVIFAKTSVDLGKLYDHLVTIPPDCHGLELMSSHSLIHQQISTVSTVSPMRCLST